MTRSEIDRLTLGSIVMYGKTPRVVRYINLDAKEKGRNYFLGFALLRKSWTGRGYTIYQRSDLYSNKWRFTGARLKRPEDTPLWDELLADLCTTCGQYTVAGERVVGVVT